MFDKYGWVRNYFFKSKQNKLTAKHISRKSQCLRGREIKKNFCWFIHNDNIYYLLSLITYILFKILSHLYSIVLLQGLILLSFIKKVFTRTQSEYTVNVVIVFRHMKRFK